MVTPSDPYLEHFGGYLELVEDDFSLFCDTSALGPIPEQEPVFPELLWYLGHHPKGEDDSKLATEGLPDPHSEPCAGGLCYGHRAAAGHWQSSDSDGACRFSKFQA